MDSLLSVKPGLVFWTWINFGIFLFLALKFGLGSILKGLKNREETIQENIDSAEIKNNEAKKLLDEAQAKIENAQKEISEMINQGKSQSKQLIDRAVEEANNIKKQKLDEATKQIDISKRAAINQIRNEVADLVIEATEKLLEEKLDKGKDLKLVESYISKLPNN